MERQPSLETCPIAATCAMTTEGALPCGEEPNHLPPMIVAEKMCINALAGRMQQEQDILSNATWPARFAEEHTTVAWYALEQGLAADDSVAAMENFDRAFESADLALHNPNSWFRDILGAATVQLYHPAFLARKNGTAPSSQEQARLRQGLGILYDAVIAAPIHVPQSQHILDAIAEGKPHQPCFGVAGERNGYVTKLVGMMLAARQGIFMYPASDRESRASGDLRSLNHDAYVLENGQKIPVKMRQMKQSDSIKGGYDEKTQYVNMASLINKSLIDLRKNNYAQLISILKTHQNKTPTILDVARILRNELGGQPQSLASLALIDHMAARFEEKLFSKHDRSDYRTLKSQRASQFSDKHAGWEILPPDVQRWHENPEVHDSPHRLRKAAMARENYLRIGNNAPDPDELMQLIGEMRHVKEPYILVSCAGAYIDLARNPMTQPSEAVRLIDTALLLTESLMAKKWQELPPSEVETKFMAGLERAYAGKYKRTLSGGTPDINDETQLYVDLLKLGSETLEPAVKLRPEISGMRGAQFEIAMHLLNARLNVRSGKIVQSMWPSLPRENRPHDFVFSHKNGWDAAITTGEFWNQDLDCKYLQLKGIAKGSVYHPSIILVTGKEDLGTTTTADIIKAALAEVRSDDSQEVKAAREKLNNYERLFLRKIYG